MVEKDLQSILLTQWRKNGYSCQKFNDGFSVGIPDLFVGNFNLGLWVELKYLKEASPERPPLVLGRDISGPQVAWLRSFWMRPSLTALFVGIGSEWLLLPGNRAQEACSVPLGMLGHYRGSTPYRHVLPQELVVRLSDGTRFDLRHDSL